MELLSLVLFMEDWAPFIRGRTCCVYLNSNNAIDALSLGDSNAEVIAARVALFRNLAQSCDISPWSRGCDQISIHLVFRREIGAAPMPIADPSPLKTHIDFPTDDVHRSPPYLLKCVSLRKTPPDILDVKDTIYDVNDGELVGGYLWFQLLPSEYPKKPIAL